MANYRKHVYYTQFRKAATVIENAIQRYSFENGCGGNTVNQNQIDNICTTGSLFDNAADKLGSMFNVTKWITDDNYQEVCKGYEKIPPALNYDGTNKITLEDICKNDGSIEYENGYGFITNDSMLLNLAVDFGDGDGSLIDINGPDKGPNIFGRDIFVFYIYEPTSKRWGNYTILDGYCKEPLKDGNGDCGSRLLIEGKMNY